MADLRQCQSELSKCKDLFSFLVLFCCPIPTRGMGALRRVQHPPGPCNEAVVLGQEKQAGRAGPLPPARQQLLGSWNGVPRRERLPIVPIPSTFVSKSLGGHVFTFLLYE